MEGTTGLDQPPEHAKADADGPINTASPPNKGVKRSLDASGDAISEAVLDARLKVDFLLARDGLDNHSKLQYSVGRPSTLSVRLACQLLSGGCEQLGFATH